MLRVRPRLSVMAMSTPARSSIDNALRSAVRRKLLEDLQTSCSNLSQIEELVKEVYPSLGIGLEISKIIPKSLGTLAISRQIKAYTEGTGPLDMIEVAIFLTLYTHSVKVWPRALYCGCSSSFCLTALLIASSIEDLAGVSWPLPMGVV